MKKLTLYQKLHDIQSKIKGLSKDKKSHNYDYVTGNKLLSFIKPLMDKHKLLLKQEIVEVENTRQDYEVWNKFEKKFKPKSEILSKVYMRFTWIDVETGDKDENLFAANGQNDWEKGLGSALTYGERYFLLKYFHIPTDADDIDNPARKPQEKESVQSKKKLTEGSPDWDRLREKVMKDPESINIDQIKKFFTLSKDTEQKIVDLCMESINKK